MRDGISRLFFLSREGWILREIFNTLNLDPNRRISSAYLLGSRRAIRLASLHIKGDVLALAAHPYRSGVLLGDLLQSRFDLASSDVDERVLLKVGYSHLQEPLTADPAGRVQFTALCGLLADQILVNASEERAAYLQYLGQAGLLDEACPGIVDIGWRANMQGALGMLIGRPLRGYYYATLQGTEAWRSKGHAIWAYAGEMVAAGHPSAAVTNRRLIEYLTCHVDPSLLKFEHRDGSVIPRFRTEQDHGVRRLFIEQVHQGAIRFARDLHEQLGEMSEELWIDPFLGERVFASFALNPHPVDAAMLKGHHFEDALGGIESEYIIHPQQRHAHGKSVWKAGAKSLYAIDEKQANSPVVLSAEEGPNIPPATLPGTAQRPNAANLWIRRMEAWIVRRAVNDKKFRKYERSREEFFVDSKNRLARAWFRWTMDRHKEVSRSAHKVQG